MPSSAPQRPRPAALATAEELEELAAEHRVTLRCRRSSGPVWTPLTERMARTVVRNLVENAVKYAGHGATARRPCARRAIAPCSS